MSNISDRAVVSPKAQIGNNVTIYPFVYIEDDVVIGDNCVIYPCVSVLNGTRLGSDNTVYQGTVLGAIPQDFEFRGEDSQLIIGNHNTFRENVVVNRATHSDGTTVIGHHNYLMEGTHVSHDTKVGDHNIFGYGVKIAGDCQIGNNVYFATSVVCQPNCRVGDGAFITSGTSFSKDIPPYIVAAGHFAAYKGLNKMVLTKLGVDERIQRHLGNAYRLVFHGQTSLFDAILQIKAQIPDDPEVREIIQFLETTQLGIITKM